MKIDLAFLVGGIWHLLGILLRTTERRIEKEVEKKE